MCLKDNSSVTDNWKISKKEFHINTNFKLPNFNLEFLKIQEEVAYEY